MITAKIVADSISELGARITTVELRYPRSIHSEFMTHRTFSRNSASSRAIPIAKILKMVKEDPFIPVWWGKNQPGMQAYEEVADNVKEWAKKQWLEARDSAVRMAEYFGSLDIHKQIINRLLEPWMHITVICTATEWENFLNLRDHPAAEPHMRLLAKAIKEALTNSTPTKLEAGEWHLPFVKLEERITGTFSSDLLKRSVARCARVSYLNHDGTISNFDKDSKMHDQLLKDGHMSPFEHQAKPNTLTPKGMSGNFRGWTQYRKTLPGEDVYVPR